MKKCKLNKNFKKSDYDEAYNFISNIVRNKKDIEFSYGRLIVDSSTHFHLDMFLNSEIETTYETINFLKVLSTLPEDSFFIFAIKNSIGNWINKRISRYKGYNFSVTKSFKNKERQSSLIRLSIILNID